MIALKDGGFSPGSGSVVVSFPFVCYVYLPTLVGTG